LYYGGTAFENTAGLGVQLRSGAERGEAVTLARAPTAAPAPAGLMAVPTTLLYDRGTTFVRSTRLHPRIPQPYIELNSADAHKLGIANGETVTVSINGVETRIAARVNGRAPAGAALVPQSLGGPTLNHVTQITVKKG
jgi:anaerobic selenocysteine-containing dehydrogenase